jgi:hypothetical protein
VLPKFFDISIKIVVVGWDSETIAVWLNKQNYVNVVFFDPKNVCNMYFIQFCL